MCRIHKWNEKGYTLVEMLVTLFIVSIIMLQAFRMLDANYKTVRNEIQDNQSRQSFKVLSSFLFEDLMYGKYVTVVHQRDYDVLHYQTQNGKDVSLKFTYENGIYELRSGKEVKIAEGKRFDENYPTVREEGGLIFFNLYLDELNILLDRVIKPRKEVMK